MNSQPTLRKLQQGYRLQTEGQTAAAERIYREILAAEPGNEHALNLLGVVCINSRRHAEAHALMERAVQVSPGDPDTQSNYALALKDVGQHERAAEAFQQSLRLRPAHPVTLNNYGNVLGTLHRTGEAVTVFRAALQLAPDYAECLSNLAAALMTQRHYANALQAADRALALRPDFAEAHNNRGEILARLYRYEDAVSSYRKAVALTPDYDAAWINMTAALKETGELAEARRILEEIVARDAGNPVALNNLGTLLEQLGDAAGAAPCFRQALTLSPAYANAYYQLAHLDAKLITAADLERIHGQLDDPKTADVDRSPLAFALACVAEECGNVDEHFRYLSMGKKIKRELAHYDRARVTAYHESLKRTFATAPVDATASSGLSPTPPPVFVLGMPRSGTSLTEQILASHPAVLGAGELSFMEDTVSEVRRLTGRQFPEGFSALDAGARRSLGQFYIARLLGRAGRAQYIVDKTPMNFQYLGFIASILPDATFIHCTRNPLDNCWSIFKLPFEDLHTYAHDLQSLGDYYRQYAGLMAHWSTLYGNRMLEVRYEDTVSDIESQSRRILDFLKLEFDPAVLQFHQTRRLVKTPSASQVRRPIYQASIAAWRPYERYLGALLKALGPELCGDAWHGEAT